MDDGDDVPRVRINALDDDQIAMVELLGGDPQTAPRASVLYYNEDERRIEDWPCPIVEWRGRRHMICRGGTVSGYREPEPKPERQPPTLRVVH